MSSSRAVSGALSLLVGLAAVVGVTLWMLREPPVPAPPGGPPPFMVPVTVVHPAVGDVSERVELVGDVQAPDRAELAFERAGRIRELSVRLGDQVQAGDVLARLDDRVMEEEVRAREAALAQAREAAALAQREAERLQKMEGQVASVSQIDRAQSEAQVEAARVVQLEADLALARTRLEQGVLSAPYDAVVIARSVALGSYVDSGAACLELLSLEQREILLELPPRVVASLRPGTLVTLTSDEFPDFELQAPLDSVLPSKEARARVFTGVVRLEPDDDPERRLRPGMFVRASVELRAARGVLTVPVDCLIEDAGETHVFVVLPGEPPTAGLVPIRVLARDEESAAVEALDQDELSTADAVVLVGKENVVPGMPLIIAVPAAAAEGEPSAAAGDPPASSQ